MSSHREAPEISPDPVADNTDTYAFVSPDRPDTVTILTNYIPLEAAAAGPNFYEFGTDVLYYIYISNSGTAMPDITYEFRFTTEVRNPNTFLYNVGTITSLDDPHFNRRQFYSVTKVLGHPGGNGNGKAAKPKVLAEKLASPPCNIGPASTPNYYELAQAAVHRLPHGEVVFAGQRNDGFFADLGAVFDLADVRPFQNLHIAPMAASPAIDTLKSGINVHTIALQIPIRELTRDGSVPTDPASALSTIGVWGAAARRKMRVRGDDSRKGAETGPWVQVSRLGMPLFNELLVPLGKKDEWNRSQPYTDKKFSHGVIHPELGERLPSLYPGVFPKLAKLDKAGTARADLSAIFLTGLPSGIVPGFQNHTGKTLADMQRLNVAIPPAASPNPLGLLAGDLAGFPNGRRVLDDVVTIELRALAGVTYALVDKHFTPDPAAVAVTQGLPTPPSGPPGSGARFLTSFPYLGEPHDGFDTPPPSP
jgi:hypothetical protein